MSKFLFAFLLLSSSIIFAEQENVLGQILAPPQKHLKNYSFQPDSSILSRVKKTEGFVLAYVRELDSTTNYTSYLPTANEMNKIKEAIELLPPLHKKVLSNRIAGIYFIDHLLGSGLTEWLIDEKGNIHSIIYINSKVLKMSLNEWLTQKEQSCFIADNTNLSLSIKCSSRLSGVFGILLHEATHAVDYAENITPFTDDTIREFYITQKKYFQSKHYFEKVWSRYSVPRPEFDFSLRKNITFYGFRKGPKIKLSEANEVYSGLTNSPFVSLYSTYSWAEDLAEISLFYHLTHSLHLPYQIKILSNNQAIYLYEPMKNPKIKERTGFLKLFY
jgi:hypothetical protein